MSYAAPPGTAVDFGFKRIPAYYADGTKYPDFYFGPLLTTGGGSIVSVVGGAEKRAEFFIGSSSLLVGLTSERSFAIGCATATAFEYPDRLFSFSSATIPALRGQWKVPVVASVVGQTTTNFQIFGEFPASATSVGGTSCVFNSSAIVSLGVWIGGGSRSSFRSEFNKDVMFSINPKTATAIRATFNVDAGSEIAGQSLVSPRSNRAFSATYAIAGQSSPSLNGTTLIPAEYVWNTGTTHQFFGDKLSDGTLALGVSSILTGFGAVGTIVIPTPLGPEVDYVEAYVTRRINRVSVLE